VRPATRPIGPPKIVLPSPLTFIGRRKQGPVDVVQNRCDTFGSAHPSQPEYAASNGSHGRARNWATPQVGNGSAVGDHAYESNGGLTSVVRESSSEGFSFADAGESVPSET